MKNAIHFMAIYVIFLLVLPFVATPWIGVRASWVLMSIIGGLAIVANITWLLASKRRDELRGRAYETTVDDQTVFLFELIGNSKLLETQDEIVFDVVRQGTDFAPP